MTAPDVDAGPWTFLHCPAPPSWSLQWPELEEHVTPLSALRGCPQEPAYHAEGDVLTHTRMVCAAMVSLQAWRDLPPDERSVLFAAALLHDVAKPACTVVEEDGTVTSHGHARRGARLARRFLWQDAGLTHGPIPFQQREAVAALVRHHGLPLWLLEKGDPRRAVIGASQVVRCDRLALLAEGDARGRQCVDHEELLERIALFRDVCTEYGCLEQPYAFPSAHSRFVYFRQRTSDPGYAAYDDTHCEVVLLSGLPGSGKDRWIAEHLPGWPVVSLDALRQAMRIAPAAPQGAVVAAAREQARAHLRAGRSFAWNATNTTRAMRAGLIDLFAAYHARVRIVYLEVAFAELLRRNDARGAPLPEAALRRLAAHLDVPDLTEAHQVEWVID